MRHVLSGGETVTPAGLRYFAGNEQEDAEDAERAGIMSAVQELGVLELADCNGPTLLSQREVAELLGVSKSRVSQLELRALEKIRRAVLRDPQLRGWVRDEVWWG